MIALRAVARVTSSVVLIVLACMFVAAVALVMIAATTIALGHLMCWAIWP